MSQSSTLYVEMDGHKDSIAVAYVAQEHGADLVSVTTDRRDALPLARLIYKRYRHLMAKGKHAPQVVVAIARELSAFMWAIAQHVAVTPKA